MLKLIKYKNFLNKFYPTSQSKKILFYFIKFIYKYLFIFSNQKLESKKCDILFLFGYEQELYRTQKLYSLLESKGFDVQHDFFSKKRFLDTKLKIKGIDTRLITEAVDAKYLIDKYSPTIVITFSHNSIISPLLKENINSIGGKLINISHAVLGDSYEFTMFDFDYYFIFGESSYRNALNNKNRFGDTKLIKVGSSFLPSKLDNIPYYRSKNILFFSTWLAESVKSTLIKNAEIVIEWAKKNPEYTLYIKLHHLENPEFIRNLSLGIKNIIILEKSTNMIEALEKVSIVITSWSNASIEAAVGKKPVVIVNSSNIVDNYLYLESFFDKRCQNSLELHSIIEKVYTNYDEYMNKCKDFVAFHYHTTRNVNNNIVSYIESIYNGKEDFDYINIKGNFDEE